MHNSDLYQKNRNHTDIIPETLKMLISVFTTRYENLRPLLHGCFDASLALWCNGEGGGFRLNASIFKTRVFISTKQ